MHKLLTALLVALAVASAAAETGTQAQKPAQPAAPPATQSQKPATPAPATPPAAQPQKPAAPPTAPATQAPKPAAPARMSMTLFVTDPAGKPIPDVKVSAVDGPVDRTGTADKDGVVRLSGVRPGTYRLRFEGKGFITFEREVTLRAGTPAEFEVTLNPAPALPAPAPPPAQAPAPEPSLPSAGGSSGQPEAQYLADWIDQNLIGRNEAKKETVVGRVRGAVASVLQVRDPQKNRSDPDADEFLYIIAGDGAVRFDGRTESVTAGWFITIPRGVSYTVERRGRNPLIVLVVAAPGRP